MSFRLPAANPGVGCFRGAGRPSPLAFLAPFVTVSAQNLPVNHNLPKPLATP
jgi:hypothetical protein